MTGELPAKYKERLRIEEYDIVGSTNTMALERASKGEGEGLVIVARGQMAGRGRLGHDFYSPKGTGLYMSVLLKPEIKISDATFVTTMAAVAVSHAIENISRQVVQIKWVNDIFIDGKKVCGILTEGMMEGGKLVYIVLGVGINVMPPKGGFPPGLGADSIFKEPVSDKKVSDLACRFLCDFFDMYDKLPDISFINEYRRRCFFIGNYVYIVKSNYRERVLAVGIDDRLRLVVKRDDGELLSLDSGQISIKSSDCET